MRYYLTVTNEELLAKVDLLTDQDYGVALGPALRAVVELHPMWTDYKYNETDKELVEFCGCCQEKYPCKTIQAIEGVLND